MKLTFTKLDIYRKCPLRFRLRYQEKLPEVSMGGRNLSLILHQTLRSFLLNARRDSGLEVLLRAYEDNCPLPQGPKQEQRYNEGYQALEDFHWKEGARVATAVALEQKFSVVVEGMEVTGRLDCALEGEDGLELVDFKFTREIPETVDPFQLQVYALGLREVTGAAPDSLAYYYLRQGRKVSFPGGEPAIQEGKERVTGLADRLQEDRTFSPQVGSWCGTCSYRRYCPAQRGRPDPVPRQQPVQLSLL